MLASARWMTTAGRSNKWGKEMTPVYVLAGMVAFVVGLGLHTAKQQLVYAPDVHVRKSRRETLSEVVGPDQVVQESRNFINKSLLRKVADASVARDVQFNQGNRYSKTT